MAENQPFPIKPRLPTSSSKNPAATPESKYWRSFKTSQITSSLIHPITSVSFSPSPPYPFAVACSASISLYSSQTLSLSSTFSSPFPDIAYSPSFRYDGRLFAAGSHPGSVLIFDPSSRLPLRRLNSHSRPSRVVHFPRLHDKLHLFSSGDDALLKYWDVTTGSELSSFQAHKDYVRAGSSSPASADLFATGSYDHTVKLWDVRSGPSAGPMLSLVHGKPVEDVLFLPSGGLIATAGGPQLKIWDVIGGGKLLYTVESHNKTVTSLCIGKVSKDGDDQFRLLSVSLDGYLKTFDYSAFKITHLVRHPVPLLSIGFSPSGSGWVAGSSNGILFAGNRKKEVPADDGDAGGLGIVENEPVKRVLRPTYYRYFQRGQNEKPSEGDFVVNRPKKVKLAEHDKLLKKFRHREAFVSALNKNNPRDVVAVMEELVARKKLLKSISNLDTEEFGLLLKFLSKNTTKPMFAVFLTRLAKQVLKMRAADIRDSHILQGYVRNLRRAVVVEIKIQQSLQEIQGIISPLLKIAGR
ncbi:hypothetical protein ACLOJK_032278 [Asimina triloba]